MIAQSLHKSSETTSSFDETKETHDALERLTEHLSSTPIPAFPHVREPFLLYTDTNLTALGAVLDQVQDGNDQVINYKS